MIESLELLHERVDLECLPLALEGIFSQTYGSLLTVTLHISIVPCVYLRMWRGLRRARLHGGDTVACVLLLNGTFAREFSLTKEALCFTCINTYTFLSLVLKSGYIGGAGAHKRFHDSQSFS